MKAAGWLALGAGAGLGFLAACFVPPELVGPYQCDPAGECALAGYSCVGGVCCKTDGGTPACLPIIVPDGGEDAGCTLPPEPDCTFTSQLGLCRDGGWACAGDTPTCVQVVFPRPETCDGTDEDCDGVTDPYPCGGGVGGPKDFLISNPDWVRGAMVASRDLLSAHSSCLLNDLDTSYTKSPAYLDGGNWRSTGAGTNFFYFQKADGGTWDLTPSGERLRIALSGAVLRGNNPPNAFSTYYQPIVYLCGPPAAPGNPETWRRYNPSTPDFLVKNGYNFSFDVTVDLTNGGANWFVPNGDIDLKSVYRVEVLLGLADPRDGGVSTFDAGITALGFSPL